jgi:hypothetical protein
LDKSIPLESKVDRSDRATKKESLESLQQFVAMDVTGGFE